MGAERKGLNISRLLGWLLVAAAVCCAIPAKAQIVTLPDEKMNVDSLRRAFADTHYYFGLYKGNIFNYNVILEGAYRFSRQSNQYLFAQFYSGYGEGLLAYKEYHQQFRIGIVIKPTLFSEY